jgi:hypothetical protein
MLRKIEHEEAPVGNPRQKAETESGIREEGGAPKRKKSKKRTGKVVIDLTDDSEHETICVDD